ncbi:hypothetical protein H9L05_04095 [Hymenobacter qilianensis]|uniref:Uncharacterized protein n=1 Tax=Hymenobacter qilianensis TaxID=1385715 RepID=A0A7H0GX83_9BACT|nr:hypothetical protein [Hymenobacter qilianensis]QNP52899.1 hypothetical protein H9L05_04095 [Hymenobacter qilianensis]
MRGQQLIHSFGPGKVTHLLKLVGLGAQIARHGAVFFFRKINSASSNAIKALPLIDQITSQTFLLSKVDSFLPASFSFFSIFECPVCASGRVVLFFCLSYFFVEVWLS